MSHAVQPSFAAIRLDKTPGAPSLQRQLYLAICAFLEQGVLKTGEPVPSSRALAAALKLSRSTVAAVFSRLCEEGLFETKPGSGVFVARTLDNIGISPRHSAASSFPQIIQFPLSATTARDSLSFCVQDPEPFAVIAPDMESLPGKEWTTIVARTSKSPWLHNGYCQPGGYLPYKKAVADYLRRSRGLSARPEQVITTSGIQQAIDLCAGALFKPGDRIAVEDPYFQPHLSLLEYRGLVPVPIPLTYDGIDVETLKKEKDLKGLLFTPCHQYPMGYVSSEENIRAVLDWARENRVWVIEDDYDSELQYGSNPRPAVTALDSHDLCIYAGSFTKVIYPGFNMGYVVVPKALIPVITGAKFLTDRHASEVHQTILAEFIESGAYDSHVRRLKRIYEKRRQAAVRAIGKYLSDFGHIEGENEGTHLTFIFNYPVDDQKISGILKEQGRIETRPLSSCYRLSNKRSGLILGYAHFKEKELEVAVKKPRIYFICSLKVKTT